MSDWIELKDLQWMQWIGADWDKDDEYRGRPKAERKVVRVRDAVMTYGVVTVSEEEAKTLSHKRSFLGWVKGSEWREVEYE